MVQPLKHSDGLPIDQTLFHNVTDVQERPADFWRENACATFRQFVRKAQGTIEKNPTEGIENTKRNGARGRCRAP